MGDYRLDWCGWR